MSEPLQLVRVLVDRRPTNLRIHEKGQEAYYAEAVMVVIQASGYVLGVEVVKPDEGDEVVGKLAWRAGDGLQQLAPAPRVVWVVRQERVRAAVAAALPEARIVEQTGEAFFPWDEAFMSMEHHMGGGGGTLPYLWNCEPAMVAEFFEAAAACYKARPWQYADDDELLEFPSPIEGDPPLLVSVMGGAGITRGVALMDSVESFERLLNDQGLPSSVFVSFDKTQRVPPTVRAEAEAHGWVVPNKSAFAVVMRLRDGDPLPYSRDDIRRLTAVLRGLAGAAREFRAYNRTQRKH